MINELLRNCLMLIALSVAQFNSRGVENSQEEGTKGVTLSMVYQRLLL